MKRLQTRVYTPESSLRNPLLLLAEIGKDFKVGGELAWQLAKRDITSQYRQSLLGVLWAFVLPLMNTLAWIFLNSSGIISITGTSIPYPLYVFTGTMLWAIFAEALTAPLQQTNSAKSMLSKINFPKEALILSGIYQTLFNAGIKVLLMLAGVFLTGIYPDWHVIFFPLVLLSLVLVGTAIGTMLTPVGMLYGDIGRAIPLILQFAMYVAPVLFPFPQSGKAAILFKINPLSYLLMTARDLLTGFTPAYGNVVVIVSIISLLLFIIALIIYKAVMPILIERMSS
jgi:lipopolysaccharide transport system permease protein